MTSALFCELKRLTTGMTPRSGVETATFNGATQLTKGYVYFQVQLIRNAVAKIDADGKLQTARADHCTAATNCRNVLQSV